MVEHFEPERSTRNGQRIVPAAPSRRTRVAVADDEKNLRDVLASILSAEGFDVRTASDGVGLMELVASFDPDVVLTDVSMPRMTGLEVARELRTRRSRARLLLMTAWPAWDAAMESAGASAVLQKPFDIAKLLDAVKLA